MARGNGVMKWPVGTTILVECFVMEDHTEEMTYIYRRTFFYAFEVGK